MDLNILLEVEDFAYDWEFLSSFLREFYIFRLSLCFFLFFQVDKVIAGIFGSEGNKSYRKEVLINTIKYSFI